MAAMSRLVIEGFAPWPMGGCLAGAVTESTRRHGGAEDLWLARIPEIEPPRRQGRQGRRLDSGVYLIDGYVKRPALRLVDSWPSRFSDQ